MAGKLRVEDYAVLARFYFFIFHYLSFITFLTKTKYGTNNGKPLSFTASFYKTYVVLRFLKPNNQIVGDVWAILHYNFISDALVIYDEFCNSWCNVLCDVLSFLFYFLKNSLSCHFCSIPSLSWNCTAIVTLYLYLSLYLLPPHNSPQNSVSGKFDLFISTRENISSVCTHPCLYTIYYISPWK